MKRNTDIAWKKKHIKLQSYKNNFFNWYLNLIDKAMKTCFTKAFFQNFNQIKKDSPTQIVHYLRLMVASWKKQLTHLKSWI